MTHTTPLPSVQSAGLIKRLAAGVYDSLLLLAVSMAYGALALAFKVQILGMELAPGEKANLGIIGFCGWLAVMIAFYGVFWRRFGQTLGMKAWRLKLTDVNGNKPSWMHCILRCVLAMVSALCLGLGYWWLLFDPDRLTWHDRLSGTRVWQMPKDKR